MINLWGSDKTKEKEFGLPEVVNCGTIWGKLMEEKSYFSEVCADLPKCQDFLFGMGKEGGPSSQKEIYVLLLGRWVRVESFFCICCFLLAFSSK